MREGWHTGVSHLWTSHYHQLIYNDYRHQQKTEATIAIIICSHREENVFQFDLHRCLLMMRAQKHKGLKACSLLEYNENQLISPCIVSTFLVPNPTNTIWL